MKSAPFIWALPKKLLGTPSPLVIEHCCAIFLVVTPCRRTEITVEDAADWISQFV